MGLHSRKPERLWLIGTAIHLLDLTRGLWREDGDHVLLDLVF